MRRTRTTGSRLPPDERRSEWRRTRRTRPVELPWPDRLLRGLAGVLAGGLVVLAVGMVVVWLFADEYGVPGPGGTTVVGHVVGAGVAVLAQRIADRRPDRSGTLAAVVVLGTTALVLGLAWFL